MSRLTILFASLTLLPVVRTEAKLPSSLDLSKIRTTVVQHNGRWMPLDTTARDVVEDITDTEFHEGHDPVLVLLAWTFDPDTWKQAPLIRIKNAELRSELKLSAEKTVFSHEELSGHQHLRHLIHQLESTRGRKLNPLESKVNDIHGKLIALQQVFHGQTIKLIPHVKDGLAPWRPSAWVTSDSSEAIKPSREAWLALRDAFLADNAAAFSTASDQLIAALNRLPAAHRPAAKTIATELRYNKLRPFRTAWMVMVLGALFAAAAMLLKRKWFDAVALAVMIAGFGLLTYGLSLRWAIAGRIPASNMFESLLFLSWGMGAFAIVSLFVFNDRSVPLTASAMGALSLCLADSLPLNHFIRPIAPVLQDTVWMSIHVPVIMVSYSVLALAVLIAHVQVVVMAVNPRRQQLPGSIDLLHYWYMHVGAILLFAGIVTGSMWAASSWGRYWGWDPKEVWSLIAFLGYIAIMHVRITHEQLPRWAYAAGAALILAAFVIVVPKLAPITPVKVFALVGASLAMAIFVLARGLFATAVKSILAFWMIIMTYVGVNYVLGTGLHSYGFGTGAVASRVFLIGGIDLALVVICALAYLVRLPRDNAQPVQA